MALACCRLPDLGFPVLLDTDTTGPAKHLAWHRDRGDLVPAPEQCPIEGAALVGEANERAYWACGHEG